MLLEKKEKYVIGGREFRLAPFVPRVQRELMILGQEILAELKHCEGLEGFIDGLLNKDKIAEPCDLVLFMSACSIFIEYESRLCALLLVSRGEEPMHAEEREKFFDENLQLATAQEVVTDFFILGEGRSILMLLYSLLGFGKQLSGTTANMPPNA